MAPSLICLWHLLPKCDNLDTKVKLRNVDMELTKKSCMQNLNSFGLGVETLFVPLAKCHGISFFELLQEGPHHEKGHELGAAGTRVAAWWLTLITTDTLKSFWLKGIYFLSLQSVSSSFTLLVHVWNSMEKSMKFNWLGLSGLERICSTCNGARVPRDSLSL